MTLQETCENFKEYVESVRTRLDLFDVSVLTSPDFEQAHKTKEKFEREINSLHDTYADMFAKLRDGRVFQDHFRENTKINTSAIRVVRIKEKTFRMGDLFLMKPEAITGQMARSGSDWSFIKTTKRIELVGFEGRFPVLSFDGKIVVYNRQDFYDYFELR